MSKTRSGEVSPVSLLSAWQDTPPEAQAQVQPEQAGAWPDTGQRSGSGHRGPQRRPHLHRQESDAFRRESGRGQGKHEVPVLDERDVLLTRAEAAAYLRKSVATLDRWAAQGIGPRPVRLSPRTVRYPLLRLRKFIGADTEAA